MPDPCAETGREEGVTAVPLRALVARYPAWGGAVDAAIFGWATRTGADNRNVARMSLLLAGLPVGVCGTTINRRRCASGMDAIIWGAGAIRAGEADLIIAGGVESVSCAPFVMPNADSAGLSAGGAQLPRQPSADECDDGAA